MIVVDSEAGVWGLCPPKAIMFYINFMIPINHRDACLCFYYVYLLYMIK